jgi:TetR/AcrR family transcriptional regulator
VSAAGGGTTKSERTKKAILDAAEELFSTLGYEGASLDAIGERAGIQGTAILYHFPSKRVLYEATLERIFSPLLGELSETLAPSRPGSARLEAAVDAIVRYAAEHPNAPRLLLREAASPSGDAREIIEAQAASNAAGVMAAFASQSGDPEVDPIMVVNIIVGAVCFYFVGPPGFSGQGSYDPRDPQLVSAFSATMRELTRSLLHLDWQPADHAS